MAGNGEEEIVVERRKVGEFIDQDLGNGFRASGLLVNSVLRGLWEQLVGQFAKPSFKHRADNIDIVEVILLKKIDVEF